MNLNYIKYSDERNKRFSIKTKIILEGKEKIVQKEAVFSEGQEHIDNMYYAQEQLKKYYPEIEICSAKKNENSIEFEFIEGDMFYDKYREAVKSNDISAYEALLKYHYKIICGGEQNKCDFEVSEKFKEWFGDGADYQNLEGLRYSNFDAIASNIIIRKGCPVFIDYEWVMDFIMPKELVVYHCIKDGYLHNPDFEKFYSFQKVLILFGFKTNEEVLDKSYRHFFDYVITDKNGKSYIKNKYQCLKIARPVSEILKEWEKCAEEWKKAVEANQELDKQLKHANTEWEKCAEEWKKAAEANQELDKQLKYSHTEWEKCAEEWKKAVEANQQLDSRLKDSNEENQRLNTIINEMGTELNEIKSSRAWRLISKIKKIKQ